MDEMERKAIELMRGELLTQELRLYEHLSRTFQWLLATLFAANGGGIVTLLSGGAHDVPGRIYALGWFAAGLVFSLLMGVLTSLTSIRGTTAMTKIRIRMEECLITDESCEKELADFIGKMQPSWKTWIPSYAGGTSFVLFVIGLGTIAGSLMAGD
jgi:hypothetical protein